LADMGWLFAVFFGGRSEVKSYGFWSRVVILELWHTVLIESLILKLKYLWIRCQWNLIRFPKLVLKLKSVNACPRYTTFLITTPTSSEFSISLKWRKK
jgi:hypothetical protein